jgi:hypothetical protein
MGILRELFVLEPIGSSWTAAEEISSFFLRQFPLREVHANWESAQLSNRA